MGTGDVVAWREVRCDLGVRKNRIHRSAFSWLRSPCRSPNPSASSPRPSTCFRGCPEGRAGPGARPHWDEAPAFLNSQALYVMTAVDTAAWCAWKLLVRVNPKSSEGKQNVCDYMRRWVLTYCGNHFTVHVCEVILQHSLSLHRTTCQLYLSNTENLKNE